MEFAVAIRSEVMYQEASLTDEVVVVFGDCILINLAKRNSTICRAQKVSQVLLQ